MNKVLTSALITSFESQYLLNGLSYQRDTFVIMYDFSGLFQLIHMVGFYAFRSLTWTCQYFI